MKKCPRCQQIKEKIEFNKNISSSDGLSYWCKECNRLRSAKYNKKHPEKHKEWVEKHKKEYLEERRNYSREYRIKYPIKYRENALRSFHKSQKVPSKRLNHNMSTAIGFALKHNKKGQHWEKLVGYTLDDLKNHFEKLFKKGMTWDLFMQGKIHIDHIIPKSIFNYTKPEHIDFKRCWALDNLQPLWDIENKQKHNSLDKPFQPNLAFG